MGALLSFFLQKNAMADSPQTARHGVGRIILLPVPAQVARTAAG